MQKSMNYIIYSYKIQKRKEKEYTFTSLSINYLWKEKQQTRKKEYHRRKMGAWGTRIGEKLFTKTPSESFEL